MNNKWKDRLIPVPIETFVLFLAISYAWFFILVSKTHKGAIVVPAVIAAINAVFIVLAYIIERNTSRLFSQVSFLIVCFAPLIILWLWRVY